MTGDFIGAWSVIELIWTGIALIGFVFSLINIGGYLRDLRALGGRQNGRRRLTRGDIRRESFRIVYYLIAIVAGILSGYQHSQPNSPSPAGLVILSILILMSAIQTAQSILDRLDNRYLMRYGLQSRDEAGRFTSDK